MSWIVENKDALLAIAGAVITIASTVCAMTNTKDKWWYRIIEIAALNIGKAKNKADEQSH